MSTGHSVVGATIAYSVVLDGFHAIRWRQIISIALSWIISPILSGITALAIFFLVDYFILRRKKDVEHMNIALPILFSFSAFIGAFITIQATVRGLFY